MRQTLLAALVASSLAWGSAATAWETNSYSDFLKGRFTNLSLTRDGRLVLAPKLDTLFSSDQAAVWSVAVAKDGTVYAGTGHRGRVYRVDPKGAASLVWTAEQPEVLAVALDPQGRLYAATSPNGKIFRLDQNKAVEVYDPKELYIWALAFGPDGALYAGTGDKGRIYRVAPDGKGEVWYESGQSHITCLAFDREGRLLAGSEPNGLLYRVAGKDKAFVLYDSSLPEIRTIRVGADGTVYAAALGGSLTQKTTQAIAPAAQPAAASAATTITVTADAQAGIDLKPKAEAPKPPEQPQAPAPQPVVDLSGVEKSAIYRIGADNSVETMWSSKEENVFDLVAAAGELTFVTDVRGRIYRLAQDLKATLLAETRDGDTVRIADTPQGAVLATSNVARLYRLLDAPATAGNYESAVHDAGNFARWGRLSWRGDFPAGSRIEFRTRSGNSQRPDKTWSDWSEPLTDMAQIKSPNARFIQWKVEMTGAGGSLDSVAVSYLPQNNRPVVRSVQVTPQWNALSAAKSGSLSGANAPPTASYSITVTDTGEASTPTSAGNPTLTLARQGGQQLLISWQADDPDGDKLIYTLWARGEDEKEWKKIKDQITDNTYALDADLLADGRYLFRVEASDRLSNAPDAAKSSELISPGVFVDNTPPRVVLTVRGNTIEADVEDTGSPLRRAEYSIDAGPWTLVEAADGMSDSLREKYIVTLPALTPGEHVVVVRAFDSSGNAGVAKKVLR